MFITIVAITVIAAALIPYAGYCCVLENEPKGNYHQLAAGCLAVIVFGFARIILNMPDRHLISRFRKLIMDIGW